MSTERWWTVLGSWLVEIICFREMVIDFRRKRTVSQPLCIVGEDVGLVEDYKYLGIHINNGLKWKTNTDAERDEQTLFPEEAEIFQPVQQDVENPSLLQPMHCGLLWSAGEAAIGAGDTNRLKKLIKKAGSVIGCKPDSLEVVDRQWSTFYNWLV